MIVLHGWFGDHNTFAQIFGMLDGDNYTYAFMDYRGYGASRALAGPHNMEQIKNDCLALADLHYWSSFCLVGHSMGGKAIQRVMAAMPDRVLAAVGITPVPAAKMDFDEPTRDLFFGAAQSDDKRRAIVNFTTGERLSAHWVQSVVDHSRATADDDAFANYCSAWVDEDFSASTQGLDTDFLALVGEHDRGVTRELVQNKLLAQYPNGRLEILPGAGHYPMQETPAHLVSVIEKFFADHT